MSKSTFSFNVEFCLIINLLIITIAFISITYELSSIYGLIWNIKMNYIVFMGRCILNAK